jgi:hypothetical protein
MEDDSRVTHATEAVRAATRGELKKAREVLVDSE